MANTAWSYSRLNHYETCPKKFWHLAIKKDIKEEESEPQRYGKEVHKALELRVGKGTRLPLHLTHLEPYAKKFAEHSGEVFTEQKLAITKEFSPTGFFDSDVWCRAILDLAICNDDKAILVDYKTGKIKDDWTQMQLAAAMFALHRQDVKEFTLLFWWIKAKTITEKRITKDELKEVWNELLPRVKVYEQANRGVEFPARPNWLCRRYCPVKACPHHGE